MMSHSVRNGKIRRGFGLASFGVLPACSGAAELSADDAATVAVLGSEPIPLSALRPFSLDLQIISPQGFAQSFPQALFETGIVLIGERGERYRSERIDKITKATHIEYQFQAVFAAPLEHPPEHPPERQLSSRFRVEFDGPQSDSLLVRKGIVIARHTELDTVRIAWDTAVPTVERLAASAGGMRYDPQAGVYDLVIRIADENGAFAPDFGARLQANPEAFLLKNATVQVAAQEAAVLEFKYVSTGAGSGNAKTAEYLVKVTFPEDITGQTLSLTLSDAHQSGLTDLTGNPLTMAPRTDGDNVTRDAIVFVRDTTPPEVGVTPSPLHVTTGSTFYLTLAITDRDSELIANTITFPVRLKAPVSVRAIDSIQSTPIVHTRSDGSLESIDYVVAFTAPATPVATTTYALWLEDFVAEVAFADQMSNRLVLSDNFADIRMTVYTQAQSVTTQEQSFFLKPGADFVITLTVTDSGGFPSPPQLSAEIFHMVFADDRLEALSPIPLPPQVSLLGKSILATDPIGADQTQYRLQVQFTAPDRTIAATPFALSLAWNHDASMAPKLNSASHAWGVATDAQPIIITTSDRAPALGASIPPIVVSEGGLVTVTVTLADLVGFTPEMLRKLTASWFSLQSGTDVFTASKLTSIAPEAAPPGLDFFALTFPTTVTIASQTIMMADAHTYTLAFAPQESLTNRNDAALGADDNIAQVQVRVDATPPTIHMESTTRLPSGREGIIYITLSDASGIDLFTITKSDFAISNGDTSLDIITKSDLLWGFRIGQAVVLELILKAQASPKPYQVRIVGDISDHAGHLLPKAPITDTSGSVVQISVIAAPFTATVQSQAVLTVRQDDLRSDAEIVILFEPLSGQTLPLATIEGATFHLQALGANQLLSLTMQDAHFYAGDAGDAGNARKILATLTLTDLSDDTTGIYQLYLSQSLSSGVVFDAGPLPGMNQIVVAPHPLRTAEPIATANSLVTGFAYTPASAPTQLLQVTTLGSGVILPAPSATQTLSDATAYVLFPDLDGDGVEERLRHDHTASYLSTLGSGQVTVNLSTGGQAVIFGAAGEAIGASVGAIGDINGDGHSDFAVSSGRSPTAQVGGITDAYVLFGGAPWLRQGGRLDLAQLQPEQGRRAVHPETRTETRFSPLGDLNNDGIDDFALTRVDGETLHAYIVFGSSDLPQVTDLAALDGHDGIHLSFDGVSGARWGEVASADMNADASPDLIVAAEGGTTLSVVFAARGALAHRSTLTPTPANQDENTVLQFRIPEGALVPGGLLRENNPSRLQKLKSIGDLNGDGADDIALTVAFATTVIVILYSGPHWSAGETDLFTESQGSITFALDLHEGLMLDGYETIESVGDINQDGYDDVLTIAADGIGHLLFGSPWGLWYLMADDGAWPS